MERLQWYPGHMTAAFRMMQENLKAVDGVIMILDARAPFASLNPKLDGLFKDKKILYVLNKTDLVQKADVDRVLKAFSLDGKKSVAVSAFDKKAVAELLRGIFSLLKEKSERNRKKGLFAPLRVMVAGIPNTGKSTVINALCGGRRAVVGNKAGVTRGKQWIRLNDLELLDTPGTMPPAFDNQEYAKHLAYIGCMNDANLDFSDMAAELIGELSVKYPELLRERYGVDASKGVPEILDGICARRGFITKGGEFDYERCAAGVIDDFRKGRIGKIILE